MLKKETEMQLECTYQHIKPYINKKGTCEELHEMCRNCERYCGREQHDYEECRDKACFKNWLGLKYLEWCNAF